MTDQNFVAEWTTERTEFLKAFSAFQADLPTLSRSHTATIKMRDGGSYEYKYADLADTWDAVRPKLKEHGLVVVQMTEQEGPTLLICTSVYHVESSQGFCSYIAVPPGSTAQDMGAKITYMRRYSLQTVLGMATEDPDADLEGQALAALQKTRDELHPKLVEAIESEVDAKVKDVVDGMSEWQYNVIWKDLTSAQKKACREMLFRARSSGKPAPPLSEKDKRRADVRGNGK